MISSLYGKLFKMGGKNKIKREKEGKQGDVFGKLLKLGPGKAFKIDGTIYTPVISFRRS